MTYQIVDGYNQAGSLVAVTTQPHSEGILYPDRIVALDATEYEDGHAYTVWHYSLITSTVYNTLLTEFGLAAALTNEVTVATIQNDRTFANYNGIIVRPINGKEAKYKRGFWRDVQFRIKHLEAL